MTFISDPKNQFFLADDVWDAWAYAADGLPSRAAKYRFHFGHLRSFLKPYVKWYCFQRLMSSVPASRRNEVDMPYRLGRADTYLCEQNYTCLDDIATLQAFTPLWEAQLTHPPGSEGLSQAAVHIQIRTHTFWDRLRAQFGAPMGIPPVAPHVKRRPVEFAADEQQIIPISVIRQIVNKLGLHCTGVERINRYHHLRLCVLVLMLCVGRRIDEVLSAPRGTGSEGPLYVHPAKHTTSGGALWFQFRPNKNGPSDEVYVSPEWEEIVRYCVCILITYSDEVRDLALPEERGLLILVASWNWTSGCWSASTQVYEELKDFEKHTKAESKKSRSAASVKKRATPLGYHDFYRWINGSKESASQHFRSGVLREWEITCDGSLDGEIYQLRTHQARHTRQSVLAADSTTSLHARQLDLNHLHPDMQFPYQHTLREQHAQLHEQVKMNHVVGPATTWYTALLKRQETSKSQPLFHSGQPILLTPRWQALIINNPQFVQANRVPCGFCALPQGPGGCQEFMNCLEAEEGGCQWFATDPSNEEMLIEMEERVQSLHSVQQASAERGQTVRAGKYELLAGRAENMQREVLQHTSQEVRNRLSQRLQELQKEEKHGRPFDSH